MPAPRSHPFPEKGLRFLKAKNQVSPDLPPRGCLPYKLSRRSACMSLHPLRLRRILQRQRVNATMKGGKLKQILDYLDSPLIINPLPTSTEFENNQFR
jgi:hypothetical protein